MNLVSKFCEKVILVIDTHPEVTSVSIFKQHQEKEANTEIEQIKSHRYKCSSPSEPIKLILENKGFGVKYHRHTNKYYGATISLVINHPEFDKYPELSRKNVIISIDLYNFETLIKSGYFDFGNYSGKTFSFDLYSSTFYSDCYRIVPDSSSDIADRVSNYIRFWCAEKTSRLQPGNVYLDRWGDLYLALTDKVWSDKIGSGWSGGFGNYSFYRNWSTLKYSEKRPGTIMIYLGSDDKVFREVYGIAKDTSSFIAFIKTLYLRNSHEAPDWLRTTTRIGKNFLRIKGYHNGKFVKQLEIPGYTELYKSLGEWEGLRKAIFETGENLGIDFLDDDGVADLEQYFLVSTDKTKVIEISDSEKKIYREYILKMLTYWICSSASTYDIEKYPEIYKKKEVLDKDIINDFINRKSCRESCVRTAFNNWWTIENFTKIGLFTDENEFIQEFTKKRDIRIDETGN